MKTIKLFTFTGDFAENKDIARDLRNKMIEPELKKGNDLTLDFRRVNSATQSFIHALISDLMRKYGNTVLDRVLFKSCNEKIKKIIGIVTDYMQE